MPATASTKPRDPTLQERRLEILRCAASALYFIWHQIRIKPDSGDEYRPFHLWPSQQSVLGSLVIKRLVIILKARQLGQTTIVLAYVLWLAVFRNNQTILLFSKGLKESKDLISRLRMMLCQLPPWLRPLLVTDNCDMLVFKNGSRFISFASRASQGDSYTASAVVVDESDLIDDLDTLLGGVKPTISAGGQLILLSRSDKSAPESKFKKLYRAAAAGQNNYHPIFLPWYARPGRTQDWYDQECRDAASTDWIWSQYPATVEEALAPRQESKRLPLKWLEACCPPVSPDGLRLWPSPVLSPAVLSGNPGLRVYREPVPNRSYVIGGDPASGKSRSKQSNPNLDDSAAIVLDSSSCEQVAVLCSKIEPSLFGDYLAQLARYYNRAGVLVERNNHGAATLSYLRNSCPDVIVLLGHDRDPGFLTTDKTKVQLYDRLAESARCGGFTLNDPQSFEQLASVESATLSAPEGLHDDLAIAACLALWAAEAPAIKPGLWVVSSRPDPAPTPDRVKTREVEWSPMYNVYTACVYLPQLLSDGTEGEQKLFLGEFEEEGEAKLAVAVAQELVGLALTVPLSNATTVEPARADSVRQRVVEVLRNHHRS